MNDLLPWSLLLLIVSTTLLALPFYPAWSEWRRPRDRQTHPADLNSPPAAGLRMLQATVRKFVSGDLFGVEKYLPEASRPKTQPKWILHTDMG